MNFERCESQPLCRAKSEKVCAGFHVIVDTCRVQLTAVAMTRNCWKLSCVLRVRSVQLPPLFCENNVVVDVAGNNAPEEDGLNVAVVAERVVDVDLEGGHAFAGPVVNADRLVDRAMEALNPHLATRMNGTFLR